MTIPRDRAMRQDEERRERINKRILDEVNLMDRERKSLRLISATIIICFFGFLWLLTVGVEYVAAHIFGMAVSK